MTSTMTATNSLSRRGIPVLARQPKAVSDAAHGLDERRPLSIDLLPKVADVGLHHVALATEVVVPHMVEDLRLAEDPRGVREQVTEELVFGGGEVDGVAAAPQLVHV